MLLRLDVNASADEINFENFDVSSFQGVAPRMAMNDNAHNCKMSAVSREDKWEL